MNYFVRAAVGASIVAALATFSSSAFAQAKPTANEQAQLAGLEYRVVDRLWANTDEYFHEGDYNRCIAMCRICVQSDPDFDEAASSAAWLLWSIGDKPGANLLMADVVKRAKNKWQAQYTFGEQLMVRKEYKDALPHLLAASKAPSAPVMVWKQLGHAYERTNNLPKSLATWQYVVKKFPGEPAGPPNLSRVKQKIKGGYKTKPAGTKSA